MSFNKQTYQFYLRKDATTYYYLNGGVVDTTSDPTPIGDVANWNELELIWKRHSTYLGVFRTQSPDQVQFVGDAAIVLRYIFNTQFSEGVCDLEIRKLNSTDLQYYVLGVFSVDFSQAKSHQNDFVAALMEGGLSALLNAYDTTPFPIPIEDTDPAVLSIDMHGVDLLGSYNYQTIENSDTSILINVAPHSGTGTVGFAYIDEDGDYNVGETNTVLSGHAVGTGLFDEAYVFKSTENFDGVITLQVKMYYGNSLSSDRNLTLQLWVDIYSTAAWGTPIVSTKLWDGGISLAPGATQGTSSVPIDTGVITFSQTFTPDMYMVLYWVIVPSTPESGSGSSVMEIHLIDTPTPLSIAYDFVLPKSICKGLRTFDVFNKLTQALTNGANNAQSNYFTDSAVTYAKLSVNWDLHPYTTLFTCGDALRQLNVDNNGDPSSPAMQMTMKDFANDCFVTLCTALSIETDMSDNEVLSIEKLETVFDKTLFIADLGSEITNVEITPYTDYLGNSMEVGYQDITFDEVNGRYEPNSTQTYKLPITRVQKDIDNKSPYVTSPYDCEYTRYNLAGKTTTDSSSDNDIFKLAVFRAPDSETGLQELFRPGPGSILAGIPMEARATIYNISFTPKRNLLRLAPFIKSNLLNYENQTITFQTAAKNSDLVSALYAPTVTENADLDLATAYLPSGPIYFIPLVFTFDAKVPLDLADLMATKSKGYFTFTYKGQQWQAFTLEAGINPGTNDSYKFKLLLTPNNTIPDYL